MRRICSTGVDQFYLYRGVRQEDLIASVSSGYAKRTVGRRLFPRKAGANLVDQRSVRPHRHVVGVQFVASAGCVGHVVEAVADV